jgi:hypothetical protein
MIKILFFSVLLFAYNINCFASGSTDDVERFDAGPALGENEYYTSDPPRVIRLNSSAPQMVALKQKVDQVIAENGGSFKCEILNNKLRRVRTEFEAAANEINQRMFARGSMHGGSTFILKEVKKTNEATVCGLVYKNASNATNEIVLAEYDHEGNELEVVKYLTGRIQDR